jgi:electron transport complex protein RnfC
MAIVGTLKTFKGGHYFKKFEGSSNEPLVQAQLPKRVKLPLRQGYGQECAPVVAVGDRVKTGQIIARSDERVCTPILAPISGKITAIGEAPHPIDGRVTKVISIDSDSLDEWHHLELPEGSFERWSAEDLGTVLYEAGVTGLGKAGFPSPFNSSEVEPDGINTLIINLVETEPYLEAQKILLYEEFEKFVTGIKILKGALGNIEVHIGIGYDQPDILEELENRLEYHDWLILHPLLPKYPQGEDEILVKSLLNREIPAGQYSTSLGIVVADVQQAVAAYDAVIEGKPFVQAAVSVGGSAMGAPANAKVRIGTLVSDLCEEFGHSSPSEIILGGPMRGSAVSEDGASIMRGTEAMLAMKGPQKKKFGGSGPGFGLDSYTRIIAPIFGGKRKGTTGLNGIPKPCIHCGYCVDVCPQNLHPIWIAEAADRGDSQKTRELDISACIDCGLCSYVCPSKIPVMEQIQAGKREIREEQLQ